MRVSEEPVYTNFFGQNPVLTTLHLRSADHDYRLCLIKFKKQEKMWTEVTDSELELQTLIFLDMAQGFSGWGPG
jgi:hypothetical protein